MRRGWKTTIGFALLGLATAAICYAWAAFYDYAEPVNGLRLAVFIISIILCPPQLLFAGCVDCEVIGRGGFIMYSIIGVLNAALYAAVGSVVVHLRKQLERNP